MNRPVIRVGDKTFHGGEVMAGSPNDGKPVSASPAMPQRQRRERKRA